MAGTIASLIVDVAANTAQLTKDVKGVNDSLDSMSGFAKKVGTALTGAFTVGAVISFAKSIASTASGIHDMSAKIGISTDAVQGFKFAAEQTGSSLDAVGTAITKMNKNLVGGDKATVGALKEVGLNLADIRSMKPEDAFLAIADAIQRVPDPMVQSHAALTLFGKSAADLLPGMKEGFRGLADSADKMSESTINALDAAQDRWEKLGNKITIISGDILGIVASTASGATSSWRSFLMFADGALRNGVGAAAMLAQAQDASTASTKNAKDVYLGMPPVVKSYADQLKEAKASLDTLSKADRVEIMAANALGVSSKDLAEQFHVSDFAIKTLIASEKESSKVKKEHAIVTAEQAHAMELLSGAYKHLAAEQKFQDDSMHKSLESTGAAIANIRHLNAALDSGIPGVKSYAGAVLQVSEAAAKMEGNLAGGLKKIGLFESIYGSTKGFLEQTASLLASAFSGGGSIIGKLKEFGTNVAKDFTAGLLSAIPGIGPALAQFAGPLVDGVKALWGKVFGSAGRDAVKDFAATFQGGFDGPNGLHAALNELGAEGERLWIKLTQGVGKNNPEQAASVIREVTAALDAQKEKQKEVESTAIAASASQIAAQEAAHAAVTSLDAQIKSLSDSIAGEAPEEFMGIVEAETRARIAGLTKEREAAQSSLESLSKTMTDSINDVASAIRDLPRSIAIELDIRKNGTGGESPEGSATSGFGGGKVVSFASFSRPTVSPSGARDVQGLRADLDAQRAQADADRNFLLVQMPKAIQAAMQKGAA